MSPAPPPSGDVYVGSMAAPVQRVPGSRSVNGKKAVSRIVDDALARIRRRLRSPDHT
jgi:hypothetical protein